MRAISSEQFRRGRCSSPLPITSVLVIPEGQAGNLSEGLHNEQREESECPFSSQTLGSCTHWSFYFENHVRPFRAREEYGFGLQEDTVDWLEISVLICLSA